MNATSTLKLGTRLQSHLREGLLASLQKALSGSLAGSDPVSLHASTASSRKASDYRLGEQVGHAGFGVGQVLAHWPDGRLLIRFDGAAKNRLIWPSLLDSR